MLAARYAGGGAEEIRKHQAAATRFLSRWKLKELRGFLDPTETATATTHANIYDALVKKYAATLGSLSELKTPKDTPLVDPATSLARSFAAWSCALGVQRDYDVVVTNTFLLADVLTEPHPHAAFGKGKVGGIAGPNAARTALARQALLASTFGIDTDIESLSELDGERATFEERAAMLGDYLLAHEVAHAVFRLPDFFDHPATCLMTSRPGETYRRGLQVLRENPGPCSKCRKWVEAKGRIDQAEALIGMGKPKRALRILARASRSTPRPVHGGRKRRMSEISVMVSRAYQSLGRKRRAIRLAKTALRLDPSSPDAKAQLEALGVTQTLTRTR